jgi:glycosyltransferase involved in cell wall biosynthesis
LLLALIIPVYNERDLLRACVERVQATPVPVDRNGQVLTRRVYLVDDGSTDGTRAIVDELSAKEGITAIAHPGNFGKGAAIRSGLMSALKEGADIVLIHDADLEYDPADHAPVLKPILDGQADAVIGSRFLGLAHRVLYYWHYVANKGITTLCNMVTNLNLSDIECCTKAMTRAVAERITIEENRFGVEPELIAKIARLKLPVESGGQTVRAAKVYEVAVSYAGRTYAEGKKIGWRDGFAAVRCILLYGLFK